MNTNNYINDYINDCRECRYYEDIVNSSLSYCGRHSTTLTYLIGQCMEFELCRETVEEVAKKYKLK